MDRRGQDPSRRGEYERWEDMDRCETSGPRALESSHAFPASLELERCGDCDHEPRRGRNWLRAADARGVAGTTRPWHHRISLESDHWLGGSRRWQRGLQRGGMGMKPVRTALLLTASVWVCVLSGALAQTPSRSGAATPKRS